MHSNETSSNTQTEVNSKKNVSVSNFEDDKKDNRRSFAWPDSIKDVSERKEEKLRARTGLALSDSEARLIIEEGWKKLYFDIPLGQFTVVRSDTDVSRGRLSASDYNILVNWQQAGLIKIVEDQQYKNFRRGNGFSWSQWNQLSVQGIQKKILVTASRHGRQYLTTSSMHKLQIPQGNFTVTKIVKNENRKKSVDDYKLIMFTYNAAWSSEYKAYALASGAHLVEKRKAIMLLKFDQFEYKWKKVATDLADANGEFNSNNVARTLAR